MWLRPNLEPRECFVFRRGSTLTSGLATPRLPKSRRKATSAHHRVRSTQALAVVPADRLLSAWLRQRVECVAGATNDHFAVAASEGVVLTPMGVPSSAS